jgi:hypothetical protein
MEHQELILLVEVEVELLVQHLVLAATVVPVS